MAFFSQLSCTVPKIWPMQIDQLTNELMLTMCFYDLDEGAKRTKSPIENEPQFSFLHHNIQPVKPIPLFEFHSIQNWNDNESNKNIINGEIQTN